MSRPLAAKGAGACLKHVLNTRLLPAPSRTRSWHVGRRQTYFCLWASHAVGRAMPLTRPCGDERPGLAEGDPIPPEDRLAVRAAISVDQLYSSERPRLLRFLMRRTSNDNARDVVQQVFARFIGLDDRRRTEIDNPQAYLRRSAANLVIDQAKAAARHFDGFHVAPDEIDLPGPDQIAALEARDMLHRLETAMTRLKPRTREIFLAHRIDGYSYSEIAALTGLSVKSVEKHMSRAIAFVDRVLSTR